MSFFLTTKCTFSAAISSPIIQVTYGEINQSL